MRVQLFDICIVYTWIRVYTHARRMHPLR